MRLLNFVIIIILKERQQFPSYKEYTFLNLFDIKELVAVT